MSTRERLLHTALSVFAEHGADGGSMREIARRAGVNVATAYHHFGSKRELFLAIFKELGFLDRPEDTSWVSEDMDPHVALSSICLGAWVLMASGAETLRLAIAELMKADPDVRSVFEEWREQGDAYIRQTLISAGLATEDNVTRRAWVLRQVIWATFISELLDRGFDADLLQRLASETATTLLEGSWR